MTMLKSFFDNQQYHIKDIAKRIKQFHDHNHEDLQPQTSVAMMQAIEHLMLAYIHVNALDEFLIGHMSENTFSTKLVDTLTNLTQHDCLECKV